MKKFLMLIILLLSGCSVNVSSLNSSSVNKESGTVSSSSDFGYVHFFYGEEVFGEECHYNFFTNGIVNTYSFSVGENESSGGSRIDLNDYGVSNLIGGDSIRISYYGEMWVTEPFPAGDASIFGELTDIEYYPSEIYEVTLDKEVIEGDQIHIGFNSSLDNFDLENYYVISKEVDGNYIKKEISDYENGFKFYYSFNTLMDNPHKYSFLYDYKVR